MRLSSALNDCCTQLRNETRSNWMTLAHVFKKECDNRLKTTLQGQTFENMMKVERNLKRIEALRREESQTFGRFKPPQRRAEGRPFITNSAEAEMEPEYRKKTQDTRLKWKLKKRLNFHLRNSRNQFKSVLFPERKLLQSIPSIRRTKRSSD
ncbi:hypothetical protein PHMEG_00012526 [Phytophthora megakarya]|uniref:Uncharacterized protein n=1 Tax=Phytophthora megakarya TaxID=4795 RepID=A0A225W8H0_9STRA|nr:hypothetical protein PHMEG_00012526 [Phytophthora megakarya]